MTIRRLISLLLTTVPLICTANPHELPADYTEACSLTDQIARDALEGVWEYPGDDIIVFIRRDRCDHNRHNIYVVESADVRLKPMQLLGTLTDTAQPGDYSLRLYTSVTDGELARMTECHAALSSDGASLLTHTPKVRVKISLGTVLPVFWKKLRLSIRPEVTTPSDKIKEGMRRVYPRPVVRKGLNPRYL